MHPSAAERQPTACGRAVLSVAVRQTASERAAVAGQCADRANNPLSVGRRRTRPWPKGRCCRSRWMACRSIVRLLKDSIQCASLRLNHGLPRKGDAQTGGSQR